MSDTENKINPPGMDMTTEQNIFENDDDIVVKCKTPKVVKTLKKIKKSKLKKMVSELEDDSDGESIGSDSLRSEDEDSIGSLKEFLAEDDEDVKNSNDSPSPKDLHKETEYLIEEASSFLGGSTELQNVKVKNGRVLRANPKST